MRSQLMEKMFPSNLLGWRRRNISGSLHVEASSRASVELAVNVETFADRSYPLKEPPNAEVFGYLFVPSASCIQRAQPSQD